MKRNKQTRFKHLISSVCHKHHFSNSNTFEIVFGLVIVSIVGQLLEFLSRDAKY
ncbi:MAG TPA: hypothetical protein VHD84_00850 [Candidatus Saccharimonadales bacterium]|nr:hypothetical protein [Candidatus Saccharimonadales bacterium]